MGGVVSTRGFEPDAEGGVVVGVGMLRVGKSICKLLELN